MAEEVALLKLKDVKLRVGLSTATIYRMMAKGKFPKPRKLGTKSLWFSPEIEGFILTIAAGAEWSASMGQNMGHDLAT